MGFTTRKLLNDDDEDEEIETHKKENKYIEKINNPIGNMPIANNPFFFDPVKSDMPVPSSQLSVVKKVPINSLAIIRSGGAIDSNLFKIDFDKNKSNRKKVILKL